MGPQLSGDADVPLGAGSAELGKQGRVLFSVKGGGNGRSEVPKNAAPCDSGSGLLPCTPMGTKLMSRKSNKESKIDQAGKPGEVLGARGAEERRVGQERGAWARAEGSSPPPAAVPYPPSLARGGPRPWPQGSVERSATRGGSRGGGDRARVERSAATQSLPAAPTRTLGRVRERASECSKTKQTRAGFLLCNPVLSKSGAERAPPPAAGRQLGSRAAGTRALPRAARA
jgi:hypothetical protein